MTWMCQATCGKYATSTTINGRVVGTGLGLTGRMKTVGLFLQTRLYFYTNSFFCSILCICLRECGSILFHNYCNIYVCLPHVSTFLDSYSYLIYASLFMPTYPPI